MKQKEIKGWTKTDYAAAKSQGWGLVDGRITAQSQYKCVPAPDGGKILEFFAQRFESDEKAKEYVLMKAKKGVKLYVKAVAVILAHNLTKGG